MTLLRPLPEIVAKLIPRLASNHDGVATARAIERTLKSQKLDWHDLAAAVIAPPTQWDYEREWPRTKSPWPESDESAEIRAWLRAVSREDWPNDWSQSFIANILARQSLDRLSKKQIAVINNIISEAHRRGVRPKAASPMDRGAA
jgi:hypothetical protein